MIETKPYAFARMELALFAAREYLRTFWWYVAVIPIFGLLAVIFGDGPLRAVGATAMLWPLTIPGRAFISSSKSSRMFGRPCRLKATEEELVFLSESEDPRRLRFAIPADQVRDVRDLGSALLLRTRRFGFAPIKREAFADEAEVQHLKSLVDDMVERRLASVPDA